MRGGGGAFRSQRTGRGPEAQGGKVLDSVQKEVTGFKRFRCFGVFSKELNTDRQGIDGV